MQGLQEGIQVENAALLECWFYDRHNVVLNSISLIQKKAVSFRWGHWARRFASIYMWKKLRYRSDKCQTSIGHLMYGVEAISSLLRLAFMTVSPFTTNTFTVTWLWVVASKAQATFLYSSQGTHLLTCVVEDGWLDGAVLEIGVCGCHIFKITFVKECVLKEDMFKIHLYEPAGKTASLSEASQKKNIWGPKWKTQTDKSD